MKIDGFNNDLHPGITMHKIPVQAGFPGLVFTIGALAVCLMGIPALRYFLVLAIALGIGIAVMLRFIPRQAGFVVLVLTGVIIVWLAGFPTIDWPEKLDRDALQAAIIAPPPPAEDYTSPFQCDCRQCQSKQTCDSTTHHHRESQKRAQAPSLFDGTWGGKMNDLPGINLIIADAGGGQVGGVVTFFFQMRGDDGQWQVRGRFPAPLLAAQLEDKDLVFEVQHHKTHGSPEFGSNARFRIEFVGENEALLYNLSEPEMNPSKLARENDID